MKTLLKLLGCWVAFAVSLIAALAVIAILHLHITPMPDSTPLPLRVLAWITAGVALVVGLAPLAAGLRASPARRAMFLSLFLLLAMGINTMLDGLIFTSAFGESIAANLVIFVFQAVAIGSAVAWLFGDTGQPSGFRAMRVSGWVERGLAAWLGWPVIYFLFGMSISPIVVPYYQSGMLGFRIPPMNVIASMQLLRSVLFLASSLPLLAFWKGSRMHAWFALGLAHTMAVGGYFMIDATFLPWVLRVTHGLEITADSFAYAGLLVLLFSRREPLVGTPKPQIQEAHPVTH